MTQLSFGRGIAAALVVLQLSGCGGAEPSGGQAAEDAAVSERGPRESAVRAGDEAAAGGSAQPAAAAEQPFVLTAADLAVYERGLRREIELLGSARERIRQTQDDEQQLEILGEIQPQALRREGAAAAGVPEQRYGTIADAIDGVLGNLDMLKASRQMMPTAADLAELPPEARARAEENARQMQAAWGDPYEGLDPVIAKALAASAAGLRQLRAERLGLLFGVAQ